MRRTVPALGNQPDGTRRLRARRWKPALAMIALAALALAAPALADKVVLTDGSEHLGTVISLDSERLRLREDGGRELVFPRQRIEKILLGEVLPPMRIEARIVSVDQYADLLVNNEPVITRAGRRGTQWVDLMPYVEDGNNRIQLVVHNEGGGWAYRWQLRINEKVELYSCGVPGNNGRSCRCCGLNGQESGLIDGIDPVWLSMDRDTGFAEILTH